MLDFPVVQEAADIEPWSFLHTLIQQ
jgi:hypothetical protein